MKFISFYLLLIVHVCLLTACGFHLSQAQIPHAIQPLYVDCQIAFSPLCVQFKQRLRSQQVALAPHAKEAVMQLQLHHERSHRKLVSVSSNTQVHQYELTESVTFQLADPTGKPLGTSQRLFSKRNFTLNSNQMLGSSHEEASLQQEMHNDISRQLVERLQSIKANNNS